MNEKIYGDSKFLIEISDAEDDICKIESILTDPQFNAKSTHLYEELTDKDDYLPYIGALKVRRGMVGKQSFGSLSYLQKRDVFRMIKDAIKLYITQKTEDKKRSEKEKRS